MCSMFGVDVVYVFHVCVPCLVLMLCMCSMLCSMLCDVDIVYMFHVWC